MNHESYRPNQEQPGDPRLKQGEGQPAPPAYPVPPAPRRKKRRDPLPYIGLGLAALFLLGNILFVFFRFLDRDRIDLPGKSPLNTRPTIAIRESGTREHARTPDSSVSESRDIVTATSTAPVLDENSLVIDEVTLSLPADWLREEVDSPESRSIYMYKSGVSQNYLDGYGHLMIIENNTPEDPEELEAMYDYYIEEFQAAGTFAIYDERLALIDQVSARTMTVEGRMNQSILYGKAVLFCTSEHFVFLSFTHPSKDNLYAMEEILKSTVPFTMFGVSDDDLRSVDNRMLP